MTNIVAIAGKKGAGKDTCARGIIATIMKQRKVIDRWCFDNEDGEVYYDHVSSGNMKLNINRSLDINSTSYIVQNYQFATPLKRMCIEILGLDERLVYGSQKDKNQDTHLRWEHMPVPYKTVGCELYYGPMTVREVLQYVGTDIFRRMYGDVWVDACVRKIRTDNPKLAVIHDCRFINEAKAVQEVGGKVIKLLRSTDEDSHTSEAEVDLIKADHVIDNRNQNIQTTFKEVKNILADWGYI